MTVIVVIGAGLAGAASAWQLSKRDCQVVLLERAVPANVAGSSHGSARIFRYAYPDSFYVDLVRAARLGWDRLEAELGSLLISSTGAVDHGDRRNPAALAAGLEAAGISHELVNPDEAHERWPGMLFGGPALWHESAGVIDAEHAVEGMVGLAQSLGADVRLGWTVASVARRGAGYRVTSIDGRSLDVDGVIVAAGGWLPDLLGRLDLPSDAVARFPQLEVRREQAFHFPYRDETAWPSFIHKTGEFQAYGLPGCRDAGNRGQKVAEYNGGSVISSARAPDPGISASARIRVTEYVARHLPGLVPEPYAETTCLFTNTPDEDFIVDRVEGITVLSPCSGHGAKFAPLVGELAARLAMGESTTPVRFRPLSRAVA